MTDTIYSVDSSALVHAWVRAYRPRSFPALWNQIDELIAAGRLRCSIEVLHELEKKDDDLHAWCKDRKDELCVEIDDACQIEVARLMGAYPRLVDTIKGRSGADPFVIGLALTGTPRVIVVTEEQPGKMRIPDVCTREGVISIGVMDVIDRERWKF